MRRTRRLWGFRLARLPAFAFVLLAACRAATPVVTPSSLGPPPPAAAALQGHLSRQEARELAVIRWIHEGRGIIQRFRDSGALADGVEWIVPGPSEILPFAGTWRGLDGVAEFQRQLDATMRYDRVELQQYLVSANSVAAVFLGEGIARATWRPFRSEILRLYTFDSTGGKIIRVRNFYDTGDYIAAVRGGPPGAASSTPPGAKHRAAPDEAPQHSHRLLLVGRFAGEHGRSTAYEHHLNRRFGAPSATAVLVVFSTVAWSQDQGHTGGTPCVSRRQFGPDHMPPPGSSRRDSPTDGEKYLKATTIRRRGKLIFLFLTRLCLWLTKSVAT